MARVILPRELASLTGAPREIEIDATTVRALVRELEKRFPGIEEHVEEGLSVAIDGEIFSDALLEPIQSDSEVHFLPRLQGG